MGYLIDPVYYDFFFKKELQNLQADIIIQHLESEKEKKKKNRCLISTCTTISTHKIGRERKRKRKEIIIILKYQKKLYILLKKAIIRRKRVGRGMRQYLVQAVSLVSLSYSHSLSPTNLPPSSLHKHTSLSFILSPQTFHTKEEELKQTSNT